jgi:hypothetical protein
MRTFNEWALERYEEGFFDSLKKGYGQGYQQARQGVEQNYDRYADAAKQALSRAGGAAKALSQKTGVPLPLATALVAAGITGGPAAVPFAALLYFVKQPLMKGANKAFDATWDAGAKVAGKVGQAMAPQPKPALESFRAFVEADTWGDWAGEKIGGAAGSVAGNVAGYGSKIAGALGQRAKEIGELAKGNPKEVARMLFLVGAGAAIGAGVGKITHEVKDFIMEKIKDQGIDPQVLSWVKQNIVLDDNGKSAHGDRLLDRRPDCIDDVCSDLRVADGAHLHHRLYGRRPGISALFQLYLALYVCDADARYEQQLSAALFWLGSGRFSQLPFDRLLVQKAERGVCQYEGLPHQSSG